MGPPIARTHSTTTTARPSAASCFTRASPPGARVPRAVASQCSQARWQQEATAAVDSIIAVASRAKAMPKTPGGSSVGPTPSGMVTPGNASCEPAAEQLASDAKQQVRNRKHQDPSGVRGLRPGCQQHQHDQWMAQIPDIPFDAITCDAADVAPEKPRKQSARKRRQRQVIGDPTDQQQGGDRKHALLRAGRGIRQQEPCSRRDEKRENRRLDDESERCQRGERMDERKHDGADRDGEQPVQIAHADRLVAEGDRDRRLAALLTSTRRGRPSARPATPRSWRRRERRG